jgi:hypothetical protein
MNVRTIRILLSSPAFQDLIAGKRAEIERVHAQFARLKNAIERRAAFRLITDEESLP